MKTDCWVPVFRAVLFSALPLSASGFSAGIQAYAAKNYPVAIEHLAAAYREQPQLSDYVAFHLASARDLLGDPAGAKRELERFGVSRNVLSPLGSKAALLNAQAALQLHDAT